MGEGGSGGSSESLLPLGIWPGARHEPEASGGGWGQRDQDLAPPSGTPESGVCMWGRRAADLEAVSTLCYPSWPRPVPPKEPRDPAWG